MWITLGCLASYLFGSLNFSLVAARIAGRGDLRRTHSGNPGASNVYRVLGARWAVGVLALDVGRGFAVVILAHHLLAGAWPGGPWPVVVCAAAVLAGNLFPVFHGFKGGKGVATTMGIYLGLHPLSALIAAALWIGLVAGPVRRPSVGSLAVAAACPLLMWMFDRQPALIGLAAAICVVVFVTHRQNIRRLLRGDEPRIGS